MDIISDLYNSLPDESEFDSNQQFDAFLVGDGSKGFLNKQDLKLSKQLIVSFDSVVPTSDIECIDDLYEFSIDDNLVDDCEYFLFNAKKDIFNKFSFLEKKSKQLKGVPVREKDLILNVDDLYLISYIRDHGYNLESTLRLLSQLLSYKDMGFVDVKFINIDNCSLCKAYDGSIYNIKELISLIGSGNVFIHKGISCKFIPVIGGKNREEYSINIGKGGVEFINFPIEYVDLLTDDLLGLINYKVVEFKDFCKLKNLLSQDVVFEKDVDTLFVHNDYVGIFSPFDFLIEWLNSKNNELLDIDIEILKGLDVFYLNGYKVVEYNGVYIDIDTNKPVKIEECLK